MNSLRTLLLLLLCVMLPISGLAASAVVGECPMQQAVGIQDDSGPSVAMPDCDSMKPSGDGKAKTGFCKMTAQCQFGSLYYTVTGATVIRPAVRYYRIILHYSQSLSIRAPDGLWRPPRSL